MTVSISSRLENHLVNLARRRKRAVVSVDDAHRYLDREGVQDRRQVIHQVFNNNSTVFWQTGDVIPSQRREAKGRKVTLWGLMPYKY